MEPQKKHIYTITTSRRFRGRTATFLATGLLAVLFCSAPAFPSLAQTRAQIAATCWHMVNNANTVQDLSVDRDAFIAALKCRDRGVDPHPRLRPNYGRSGQGASTTARSQIPSRTCPPFTTCHYGARIATTAAGNLNTVAEGQSFVNVGYGNVYRAPQFSGNLPASYMPEHLANGGTIYFYGGACVVSPPQSLVVPNSGFNQYSDGGSDCYSNGGHLMVPSIENGDIMAQQPVTVQHDTEMNWDYSGIIVLPNGFSGVINGQQVTGGVPIFLNHSDDFYVPAGTQLYTLPNGTNPNPNPENTPPIEYPPYTGPDIIYPDGMIVFDNGPPETRWW